MKVYAAIHQVQTALAKGGISKSRKNKEQGYSFRGVDDVMNALAPALASARLCIFPRVLTREKTERPSKSGGVLFCTVVEMEFDFVAVEDGSTHTVRVIGEAMDSADKSSNKAMSAGYKYACLQTFCIPTEAVGEDADAVTPEPIAAAPTGRIPLALAAPVTKVEHPKGYLEWLDQLRGAAMHGTPTLEASYQQAPKLYRIHLQQHGGDLLETLKAIAARTVRTPQQTGAAS